MSAIPETIPRRGGAREDQRTALTVADDAGPGRVLARRNDISLHNPSGIGITRHPREFRQIPGFKAVAKRHRTEGAGDAHVAGNDKGQRIGR